MAMYLITLFLMGTLMIVSNVAKPSDPNNVPDNYEYYDYAEKYDDRPAPSKRAALLLDRLMVALQKAIDDQAGPGSVGMDTSVSAPLRKKPREAPNTNKPNVNRRAQGKGPVYWRCYFNAVTCF